MRKNQAKILLTVHVQALKMKFKKIFKKFLKNTCKIMKVILKFKRSGKKWYKVVEKWKEVKNHC